MNVCKCVWQLLLDELCVCECTQLETAHRFCQNDQKEENKTYLVECTSMKKKLCIFIN